MKYSFFLQLKMQEGKWITMGKSHIISWDTRDLITESSGWFIINQDRMRLASELVPMLLKGIFELTHSSQDYVIYEILHGFGTIQSVLQFYKDLLSDCQQYPYTELYGCVNS